MKIEDGKIVLEEGETEFAELPRGMVAVRTAPCLDAGASYRFYTRDDGTRMHPSSGKDAIMMISLCEELRNRRAFTK